METIVRHEANLGTGLAPLSTGDLIGAGDLTAGDTRALFATAALLADDRRALAGALGGLAIAMLFEKPSLRTRATFEIGPARLGAHVMYFDHAAQRIGVREPVKDYARNLERWVDAIVARTFQHATVEALAAHADIPVVNALTDAEHPCQALADWFTLHRRFGEVAGLKVAYVGDGNNVCHSLMILGAILGAHVVAVTPAGHEPMTAFVEHAAALAASSGGSVAVTDDPAGVEGAHGVYTDTWISMGATDSPIRRRSLEPYRVTPAMMARADAEGVFMHCLPATRGDEVSAEVIDGPRSVVYDQAENRMHVQNALLAHLLLGRAPVETHGGR